MGAGVSGVGIGQHVARPADLEQGHVSGSVTTPLRSMVADRVMKQRNKT